MYEHTNIYIYIYMPIYIYIYILESSAALCAAWIHATQEIHSA